MCYHYTTVAPQTVIKSDLCKVFKIFFVFIEELFVIKNGKDYGILLQFINISAG